MKKVRHIFISLLPIIGLLCMSFAPGLSSNVSAAFGEEPTPYTKPVKVEPPTAFRLDTYTSRKAGLNYRYDDVPLTISSTADFRGVWVYQTITITAKTKYNLYSTPYYLSIFDNTAGKYVAICSGGTVCSATVGQSTPTTHTYTAYVSTYPTSMSAPPPNIQAQRSTQAIWHSSKIYIGASTAYDLQQYNYYDTKRVGEGVPVTITAGTDYSVQDGPFYILIYDATSNKIISYCAKGNRCTAIVRYDKPTVHRYEAYLSEYNSVNPPTGTIATNHLSDVLVTWVRER